MTTNWRKPTEPPDADMAAIARVQDDEWPLYLAQFDGETWRDNNGIGLPAEVTGWMHLETAAAILDSGERRLA